MSVEIGSEWVRACGQIVTVTRVVVVPGTERIAGGERVIVRGPEWEQRSMLTPTLHRLYRRREG